MLIFDTGHLEGVFAKITIAIFVFRSYVGDWERPGLPLALPWGVMGQKFFEKNFFNPKIFFAQLDELDPRRWV